MKRYNIDLQVKPECSVAKVDGSSAVSSLHLEITPEVYDRCINTYMSSTEDSDFPRLYLIRCEDKCGQQSFHILVSYEEEDGWKKLGEYGHFGRLVECYWYKLHSIINKPELLLSAFVPTLTPKQYGELVKEPDFEATRGVLETLKQNASLVTHHTTVKHYKEVRQAMREEWLPETTEAVPLFSAEGLSSLSKI